MAWYNNIFGGRKKLGDKDHFYTTTGGVAHYDTIATKRAKLEAILSNPAALAIFKLQCDLFSLGSIEEVGNPDSTNPLITKLKDPNPFQGQRQFLWDYMFYLMLGNAYVEAGSTVLTPENNLYWLNNANIEFPHTLTNKLNKHYQSEELVEALGNEHIIYRDVDGSSRNIPLSKIEAFSDITNSLGNWYAGPSAIDALYKIIGNSELSLDAKNINLDFSGKFIVSGDVAADDVFQNNLTAGEKKSVEDVVNSSKKVTAIKSKISIARYVDDLAKLKLDEAYFASYYKIGKIFNIPKDLLEADLSRGAKLDNQSLARAAHVEYTLQPKGADLIDGLKSYFNIDPNIKLKISWDSMLFMSKVKADKADADKTTAETVKILVDAGVQPESINELLGTSLDFKTMTK